MTNSATTPTRTSDASSLAPLRWSAALLALLSLVQLAMGHTGFFGKPAIEGHGVVGYLTFATSIIAAFFAWRATRAASDKGMLWHALGMVVLAIIQIGMGEMGGARVYHMGLGILFVIGAIAMATLAWRRPRG